MNFVELEKLVYLWERHVHQVKKVSFELRPE